MSAGRPLIRRPRFRYKDVKARRFDTPMAATKELHEHLNAWTSGLSQYALQLVLALIGANWAIHQSTGGILQNVWAKWSIAVAIAYLAFRLCFVGLMVLLTWMQHRHADCDKRRWATEFHANAEGVSPWPYTPGIERIGKAFHALHFSVPLASGVLLLFGLVC